MIGHTPGPWRARRNSHFWEVCPERGGDEGIPFSVADVCSSEPGDPDGGLQEANARLIAAAPELLEALEDAMRSARHDFAPGPEGEAKFREAYAEQVAAIAKAKGGAA